MPRSSRHKSSKHSLRDARDYSDSDKDSSLKDKKAREEARIRVSKDLVSAEKRKQKYASDARGLGNGELADEYRPSKRRKDRAVDDDGVGADRWDVSEIDRGEKKEAEKAVRSKASCNSKSKSSRRHDGLSEKLVETEDVKKSSKSRVDRDSSRRENKDGGSERERKGKEGKGEKYRDNVMGEVVNREVSGKHGTQVGDGEEEERRAKKLEDNTGKVTV